MGGRLDKFALELSIMRNLPSDFDKNRTNIQISRGTGDDKRTLPKISQISKRLKIQFRFFCQIQLGADKHTRNLISIAVMNSLYNIHDLSYIIDGRGVRQLNNEDKPFIHSDITIPKRTKLLHATGVVQLQSDGAFGIMTERDGMSERFFNCRVPIRYKII